MRVMLEILPEHAKKLVHLKRSEALELLNELMHFS